MKNVKVQNMYSSRGNKVANQFIIDTQEGCYFQSYRSLIAFIPHSPNKKTKLDSYYWDYSRTTGKYRNIFLSESKAETEAKIKSGRYELIDLNS